MREGQSTLFSFFWPSSRLISRECVTLVMIIRPEGGVLLVVMLFALPTRRRRRVNEQARADIKALNESSPLNG